MSQENPTIDERDPTTCNSRNKSRKRTRNIQEHKIYQKKLKVQSGLEHITKLGNVVPEKVFYEQAECVCKNNCAEKIDVNRQKAIFNSFYSLENWSKKRLFLRSLIKTRPVKESFNPVTTKTRVMYDYFLLNSYGNQEKVCFGFFLKCMQISKESIYRCMKTSISNETAKDNRGRGSTKKTSENDLKFVENFIRKLPSYRSHYGPSKSDKKFLHPNLNIKRLYREYCIISKFKKRKPVSEWKFRETFNTKFNLGFHPKRVDTCRTCDKYEASLKSETTNTKKREQLSEQKERHLQLVSQAKETFKETIRNAQDSSSNVEILVFDLQRALELPSLATSEAFYRRQHWCYNLCVFDEKRKIGYHYFWDESVASRGSQEISSCLKKHFEKFVPKETEKIILISDACGGQNRNIKTTLCLKKILDSWPYDQLKSIEQRFFISGHSYNSCDRCFGVIERQKKVTEMIYVPEHWINIIKQSKKSEPKFVVIKMSRKDFFSCKQLESITTNRKKSLNKDKVEWLKIQKIVYNRSTPFNLKVYKYGAIEPIEVSLRKRGKMAYSATFGNVSFVPLYTQSRPIKRKKYDDLQKLLEFVPSEFHKFYTSLKYEDEEPSPKRMRKIDSNKQ